MFNFSRQRSVQSALLLTAWLAGIGSASAQDDAAKLATELANPIASLISVPFQSNYDTGIGPKEDGERYLLNIQPVIPFKLSPEWNLISRTIVPVISQRDIFPGADSQFGLSDTVQSLFFSPSEVRHGFTWGVGPVALLPTATDELLGVGEWGAGPTAVALWQGSGWTIGALANHIWSFESDDVNATFVQPFLAYTTKSAWTFLLNSEFTYTWTNDEWSIPLNFTVAKRWQS